MENRTELNKTLKPHWVWAIALGSAIGWGAFIQPVDWMATAGPLGVIIGFGIGAMLMMLIAVSYGFLIRSFTVSGGDFAYAFIILGFTHAFFICCFFFCVFNVFRMGSMLIMLISLIYGFLIRIFPVSGGEFAYAFISLGRTHAFISGWFLTLGYICIVALNASAFSLMFKYVFPSVIEHFHIYTISGWVVYGVVIFIVTVVLIVFGYLDVKGTGISGGTQFIFAVVMVASVVLLTIAVGGQPNTSLANMQPYFPSDKTTFAAIISIVAIAPWAYVGFDAVPQAAEEFDFPARKAFGLIIYALIAAAAIYRLMIIATSIASPWEEVVAENNLWGTGVIIENLLGVTGLGILVIALTMGIFTGLNGFVLAG